MSSHTASMERPLLNVGTKWLKVLEEGSFFEFATRLAEFAHMLERETHSDLRECLMNMSRTLENFDEDGRHDFRMVDLSAAINPDVLKALLRGTVAFERYQTRNNYSQLRCYEQSGPGVYFVGICIEGRGGKFLTRCEIKELCVLIRRYCNGHLAACMAPSTRSPSQKDDMDLVVRIDGTRRYVQKNPAQARYIETSEDRRKMIHFSERLLKRCNPDLDREGRTPQEQSPVYIGCSANLRDRMAKYESESFLTNGLNKPLTLVFALIRAMGKYPKTVTGAVLRVWENDLLPPAERLVSTFAGSLMAQYGFNATEAGGYLPRCERHTLDAAKASVFVWHPWMMDNLRALGTETDSRLVYIDHRDKFERENQEFQKSLAAPRETDRDALDKYRDPVFHPDTGPQKVKDELARQTERADDATKRTADTQGSLACYRHVDPDLFWELFNDAADRLSADQEAAKELDRQQQEDAEQELVAQTASLQVEEEKGRRMKSLEDIEDDEDES